MFDPLQTVELQVNTSQPQMYLSRDEISKSLTKSIFSGFFNNTLDLGLYDVCLRENNALTVNGSVAEGHASGRSLAVQVKEVVEPPFTSDFVLVSESNCVRFGGTNKGLLIGSSTISLGTFASIPMIKTGPKEYSFSFGLNFQELTLFIKEDPYAFLSKWLVLILSWGSINILVSSLKKFILKEA